FNGDIGICLWGSSGLSVYFEGETLRMVAVDMLSDTVVSTAYAITVHKSQGSEWQKVAIIFDENSERLLSKELIYTAVT
ncbi:ATP-binding domain-containing protein, partial [Stenotrophomonas maltophilia]